jgi:hypothetical protein
MVNRARAPRPAALYRALIVAALAATWLTASAGAPLPVAAVADPAITVADPVIAAAGDIACDPTNSRFNDGQGIGTTCRQLAVSNLLVNGHFAAVLALGDTQYNCGGYAAFEQSYDLSWGRVKSITHPVVGNHEYMTTGGTGCTVDNTNAAGYFKYFGAAAGAPGKGYYSFNVGAWHLIALNSSCAQAGGCSATSPQGKWLAADIAAHRHVCTLAFWHIPLFSSGGRANVATRPLWQQLYAAHADVILDGHDHIYERFAPQTPAGVLDVAHGIREITVGTGGADHTSLLLTRAANSVVANTTSFGVLELTLHATSYSWKFVPALGSFTDSGSANCVA